MAPDPSWYMGARDHICWWAPNNCTSASVGRIYPWCGGRSYVLEFDGLSHDYWRLRYLSIRFNAAIIIRLRTLLCFVHIDSR